MFGYPNGVCVGTSRAEPFDPVTGSFVATGNMTMTNPKGGILLPDGRVLFAGNNVSEPLAHVELYDPSTGNFTVAVNFKTLGAVFSVTLLNYGSVLFTGGIASSVPVAISAGLYESVTEFSLVQSFVALQDIQVFDRKMNLLETVRSGRVVGGVPEPGAFWLMLPGLWFPAVRFWRRPSDPDAR
jgi:hypothetical protein